ncbi:UDP-N-acetylmuramoyl-tripeptide--D-alanyl-D-alanine ligase [candidate division FCPU426 bacterium]|nr:UDP-N-acetylmuramoyl-tripeptide--D-alanyl-D-alanine ligase [candidate division FCPU426 bacterium]
MEGMTLGKISTAVGGRLLNAPRNRKVTGVVIDSRQVKPGCLFVALKGNKRDGHEYLEAAIAAGAVAGLSQQTPEKQPLVVVKNTRAALGDLAAAYRQLFSNLRVAAITGSSGKTTTKEMLGVILARRGKVLESEGNYNNDLGVPLTVLRLTAKHQLAVVEMGMNAPGEIRRLAHIARPWMGIITNIGDAHIGAFRNRRALANAKLELLSRLEPGGMSVLNADDPYLAKAASGLQRVLTFGMVPHADVRVLEAGVHLAGTHAVLGHASQREEIRLKALGVHQAWNAAAAVAGAVALGISFKAACDALTGFRPKTSMRLELLRIGQHRLINDAYNSNPQSASAALELLAELPSPGKKYFVVGSMLELGVRSPEAHRELGHQAAISGIDGLITVGSEARSVAVGARRAGGIRWMAKLDSVMEVMKTLQPQLSVQGDLILVKGSRGIGLEAFVEEFKRVYNR